MMPGITWGLQNKVAPSPRRDDLPTLAIPVAVEQPVNYPIPM